MTAHAKLVTRIVDVVMVAEEAVFGNVIKVSEVHRKNLIGTIEVVPVHWFLPGKWGSEDSDQDSRQNENGEYCLHDGRFRTTTKISPSSVLTIMNAPVVAIGGRTRSAMLWRPIDNAIVTAIRSAAWYQALR